MVFGAVVCWSAVAFFVIQLRSNTRDFGRIALITAFVLEGIGYALDPPSVGEAIAVWSGIPNVVSLIIVTASILWCAAIVIAFSCWHDSPQQHMRTTRVWSSLAVVTIIALVVVWFRASLPQTAVPLPANIGTNGWAVATMIIYAVTLIIGLVKIRSLCARYANSSQKSWVAQGLKLVRWGADINLGYACVFLAGVLAPFFGTTIPYWDAVTVPAVITSTILILAGFALPSLGPELIDVRRRLADTRAHRTLEPLWEDLVLGNPHIALRESDRHKISYRLYRRVVEIRDGITYLAEFITPDAAASGSDPARTAAQQLRRAMTEKTVHRGADYSDGFAPLVGDNPNASVDEEIRWLCQLAKHYAQLDKKPMTPMFLAERMNDRKPPQKTRQRPPPNPPTAATPAPSGSISSGEPAGPPNYKLTPK
jgi:hypothetical protein